MPLVDKTFDTTSESEVQSTSRAFTTQPMVALEATAVNTLETVTVGVPV